ncbi:MAG: cobalamin biosynthesis protein CbiX [Gammaproteobacteria bacterium]|nr:cobalamin biosynthesis protein CbiX [Gammaproteobacteria bacterium]
MAVILLVDNGSVRAAATLQLRKVAANLSAKTALCIHPVSLQHANTIDPAELDNKPADIFYDFMRQQLILGQRRFIILPLFFANSKALTSFIPKQVSLLQQEFGDFELTTSAVIYPLPEGEANLAKIIYQHITDTAIDNKLALHNIVLVDHGSPVAAVTAVRQHLASQVQQKLGNSTVLNQAVMERRKGREYDFNGELLEHWLTKKAQSGEQSAIVCLLFFLPGRHAGVGGDITEICQRIMSQFPDFNIAISPLISQHPLLLSILQARLQSITH